ncbi:MAG: aminodeoxychorismate/anthranilate synthase component II [Bacillaceae bacterium]|nr:aminodeoxychorismate/anthranilate synthase component II [Bacillaceae bacterium]
MIIVIDNYDSFTFNLVQYVGEMGHDVRTFRNDRISIEEIETMSPGSIILSPGPCTPDEAGISLEVVRHFSGKIPILGVCLGHQSIAQAFGANIIRADRLMHGKVSQIYHDGKQIFSDIPSPFRATRYHSLIVERESLPESFEISAWTEAGEIMAIRHVSLPVEGVQFHPESIMTDYGKQILSNFISCYHQDEPYKTTG